MATRTQEIKGEGPIEGRSELQGVRKKVVLLEPGPSQKDDQHFIIISGSIVLQAFPPGSLLGGEEAPHFARHKQPHSGHQVQAGVMAYVWDSNV